MKLSEAKNILLTLIPQREPVLLIGPPGGGKTSMAKLVGETLGYKVVLRHPCVEESVDSKGIPSFYTSADAQPRVRFTLSDDWRQLCDATEPTLVVVDDLGQASPSVQAPYMQWILERQVNGQRVSDHVTFVACTNRRGDAAGVQGMITPLLSRFTTVLNLDFDALEWSKWALANQMPDPLIGFARFKPDLIGNSFKPSRDMEPSPTPRGWASVGRMVGMKIHSLEAWAGAVGEGAAVEFKAFFDTYGKLPDPQDILKNPEGYPVPTRPDIMYALVTAMSAFSTKKNFDEVLMFIERLPAEYQTVYFQDTLNRMGTVLLKLEGFRKWTTKHKTVLFS